MPVTVYVTHVKRKTGMPTGNATGAWTPWLSVKTKPAMPLTVAVRTPSKEIKSFGAAPEVQLLNVMLLPLVHAFWSVPLCWSTVITLIASGPALDPHTLFGPVVCVDH